MWVQLHTSPLDLFSWGKAHTQHYTRLPSCRPCTAREDGLCWDSERSISASACKVSILHYAECALLITSKHAATYSHQMMPLQESNLCHTRSMASGIAVSVGPANLFRTDISQQLSDVLPWCTDFFFSSDIFYWLFHWNPEKDDIYNCEITSKLGWLAMKCGTVVHVVWMIHLERFSDPRPFLLLHQQVKYSNILIC